jgi:hypothetical protein
VRHGAYPGLDDLFPPAVLDRASAAVRCPRSPAEAPPGWSVAPPLGISREIVDALPAAAPALRDATAACRTIHVVHEFWPSSYEAAVPQLRAMYRPHSVTGTALRAALRFNASRFNIAVHVRVGDLVPTPLSYFPGVLAKVLEELEPLLLRPPPPPQPPLQHGDRSPALLVDVWVFSEDTAPLVPLLEPVVRRSGGSRTRFFSSPANLTALETFTHLLESDVFVGSDSSFSWLASFLATRPVVLTAPNLGREAATFRNYISSNVRVSAEGKFERGHVAAAAERWMIRQ